MVRSVVLTILLAIVFFVAGPLGYTGFVHPQWPVMLLFFLSVSLLIHRLMEAGFQNNRANFVPFYMVSTIARFLLSTAFVGFFLFWHVEQRRLFIIEFFVLYMFYTSFEIFGLGRNLRRDL
ncbi:MAG: hypothetical protein H7Z72_07400 [Bacteroidetes bacterium]|nr:hypothetical protein [Fibrella sp.]